VACDDGDECTENFCDEAEGCQTDPLICNDGNPCTLDSCDPATGCLKTPVSCDDGNACTLDACNKATGACAHVAATCNDSNACTFDACDSAVGCKTTPVVCDDEDDCTVDSCNPASGCVNAPTCFTCTEDVECDDGNPCSMDMCVGGTCGYTLPDPPEGNTVCNACTSAGECAEFPLGGATTTCAQVDDGPDGACLTEFASGNLGVACYGTGTGLTAVFKPAAGSNKLYSNVAMPYSHFETTTSFEFSVLQGSTVKDPVGDYHCHCVADGAVGGQTVKKDGTGKVTALVCP